MRDFDPCDSATWPVVLTAQQVAVIFHRSVMGLKKACQRNRFLPAPFQTGPYLWRRSDVLRRVDNSHHSLRRVG